MSAAQPTASAWTCDGCGVSASRLDGQTAAQPSSWANSKEGRFCLACRRDRAGEIALGDAPVDCSRRERLRIRRTGLIEFEVRRSPDSLDRRIANSLGTSTSAVAAVRRDLAATP